MDPKHSLAPAAPGSARFVTLPKALLHEHLDGGLRPQTLLDLCRERGIAVPADNAAALAAWMHEQADSGSLERYLRGFALTVAAMATPEACERVAFEAAEDALEDGCVLAEFRMAPLLLEPFGLAPEAVMEAFIAGLAKSRLRAGLIVCGMRPDDPGKVLRAAKLAVKYRGQGVVGFDLAGAELGYRADVHRKAFDLARDGGLGLTCHAGEAGDGDNVMEALELGVARIGHGLHIMDGTPAQTARWLDRARAAKLHFEVCPSSNVHTAAVPSLEAHPIGRMLEAGLSVSCNTDNRLMSQVKLSGELQVVHERTGLSWAQVAQLTRNAVEASFLPAEQKRAAMDEVERAWPVAA
jgi:adenosine deaminase